MIKFEIIHIRLFFILEPACIKLLFINLRQSHIKNSILDGGRIFRNSKSGFPSF